jgi:hypothetical protein
MFKKAYISMHSFDKTCVVVYVITHDIAPEGKQFEAAYDLTLRKLEKDLPKNARNLLKYVTHINHTVIPIQLLESLLETDSTTKEADVNTFLAVLCDYSLVKV